MWVGYNKLILSLIGRHVYYKSLSKGFRNPINFLGCQLTLLYILNFAVYSRLQRICAKKIVEEAWLKLLQPHSEPVTREVIGHHEGGGDGDV